ncbi:hypothetical protein F5148DRAFT_983769 [Russula earlei]|uniref:Uncharacterized protein n=1 Tax=Russula earlei TaxID=71964 RepID=A0ACC0U3L3_9AGAM|nr:hypothetical protein F5148DRAFT_983769 [Russula earlei]
MTLIINLVSTGNVEEQDYYSPFGIECLSKEWKSPIYAFYEHVPDITYVNSRHCHEFKCAAHGCKYKSQCYLNTKDKTSTGNLIKYGKSCWGEEAWNAANECNNTAEARELVTKPMAKTVLIMTLFKWSGKGKVTYSHCIHMRTETKCIVEDHGFLNLMKTGCLEHYLSSTSTMTQDVKLVFGQTREQIENLLQEYNGSISFATDAWTSPNHYAYVTLSAHFETQGQLMAIILDVVKVPKSHTGINLVLPSGLGFGRCWTPKLWTASFASCVCQILTVYVP